MSTSNYNANGVGYASGGGISTNTTNGFSHPQNWIHPQHINHGTNLIPPSVPMHMTLFNTPSYNPSVPMHMTLFNTPSYNPSPLNTPFNYKFGGK